jgi:hypothetical protein
VPAFAPVGLTLTPAAAADGGHPAHEAGAVPVDEDAIRGTPQGPEPVPLAGWIVAALLSAAGAAALYRGRRRSASTSGAGRASGPDVRSEGTAGQEAATKSTDGTRTTDESETTGTTPDDRHRQRVTAWSYRDGP